MYSPTITNVTPETEKQWYEDIVAMRKKEETLIGESVNFTLCLRHIGGSGGTGKVTKVTKPKLHIDVIDSPRYHAGKHTLRLEVGTTVEISRVGSPAYGEDNHLSNEWSYGKLLKERYMMARSIVDSPELAAVFMHYYPILHPHMPKHGLVYDQRSITVKLIHRTAGAYSSSSNGTSIVEFRADKKYFSVHIGSAVFGMENPSWEDDVIRSLRTMKAHA